MESRTDSNSIKSTSTNPRGIPVAPFVDKVEDYVSSRAEVDSTMRSFQEMISYSKENLEATLALTERRKYQFMEVNTQRRAAGLNEKIPDIQKTLDTVRFLKSRKAGSDPLDTTFELNDTLYVKAKVPPTDEVFLWLGANVMLAYPIDEAVTLLEGKLDAARQSLNHCEEDLDFLREQITTLEVATARVYNWDVTQKRKAKAGGAKEGMPEDETNS